MFWSTTTIVAQGLTEPVHEAETDAYKTRRSLAYSPRRFEEYFLHVMAKAILSTVKRIAYKAPRIQCKNHGFETNFGLVHEFASIVISHESRLKSLKEIIIESDTRAFAGCPIQIVHYSQMWRQRSDSQKGADWNEIRHMFPQWCAKRELNICGKWLKGVRLVLSRLVLCHDHTDGPGWKSCPCLIDSKLA
jgi:hypothetical protein